MNKKKPKEKRLLKLSILLRKAILVLLGGIILLWLVTKIRNITWAQLAFTSLIVLAFAFLFVAFSPKRRRKSYKRKTFKKRKPAKFYSYHK